MSVCTILRNTLAAVALSSGAALAGAACPNHLVEWPIVCPPFEPCHADSGPFHLTAQGRYLVLSVDRLDGARVVLKEKSITTDLEHLLNKPMEPVVLGVLGEKNGTLIRELGWQDAGHARTKPLHDVGELLLALQNGGPPQYWRAGVASETQETEAVLGYMAVAAETGRAGGKTVLPNTKPQIEFAIHAQDGDSVGIVD